MIKNLIREFNDKNLNDFIRYFHFALDLEKKITSERSDLSKNKYIKIRKTGLQYILTHQKGIQASINK